MCTVSCLNMGASAMMTETALGLRMICWLDEAEEFYDKLMPAFMISELRQSKVVMLSECEDGPET